MYKNPIYKKPIFLISQMVTDIYYKYLECHLLYYLNYEEVGKYLLERDNLILS